jgi:hypothetical protein
VASLSRGNIVKCERIEPMFDAQQISNHQSVLMERR